MFSSECLGGGRRMRLRLQSGPRSVRTRDASVIDRRSEVFATRQDFSRKSACVWRFKFHTAISSSRCTLVPLTVPDTAIWEVSVCHSYVNHVGANRIRAC